MPRKLVVKRLKASDLSFFHGYLRNHPQSKQKSFNLNRDVIEDQFFPSLSEIAESRPRKQLPVQLTFYGPGGAAAHTLMRKILKQEKNWRLNGEVVYDPDDQPERYDILVPDDLALMEFTGSGEPSAVKVVLLSANHSEDANLFSAIDRHVPTPSMWVPGVGELERIIRAANPAADHPVRDWLDDALIEDVGLGGGQSAQRLENRRMGRGLTRAELQDAKDAAEAIGRRGEVLLNHHLENSLWPGVRGHVWIANENAVAPYDFELEMTSGVRRLVDAKSTSGDFDNPLHMSLGEISIAVNGENPYDIARFYSVREGWGHFRIASDIGSQLRPILDVLALLPNGVSPDSLSFEPSFFDFSPEEYIVEIGDEFI